MSAKISIVLFEALISRSFMFHFEFATNLFYLCADLKKTLSELGLFDRQALILVPHSKIGGYPKEGSVSSHQSNANKNIGSSSGSSEGYFSYVKKIISYMNPFSYIGDGTSPPSSVHESQSSTGKFSKFCFGTNKICVAI